MERKSNCSLAAKGHSLTACNTTPPAKSKMAAWGPKNGLRGLERCSKQLLLNKSFDPSTPSMRKVDYREKKRKKIMSFLVATNVVASRLPERRPTGTPHARANCHQPQIKTPILSTFVIPVTYHS